MSATTEYNRIVHTTLIPMISPLVQTVDMLQAKYSVLLVRQVGLIVKAVSQFYNKTELRNVK